MKSALARCLALLIALPPAFAAAPSKVPVSTLPPVVVAARLTAFGMTVVTNGEAERGGRIAWMLVGDVMPRSPAADADLRPGDKILRVDGTAASRLSVEAMLEVFFRREVGERIKLDLAERITLKRRSVELVCRAP